MNAWSNEFHPNFTTYTKPRVPATSSNSAREKNEKLSIGNNKVITPKGGTGSGQKKQNMGNKKKFYCELCEVPCTAQSSLDDHLVGRRHLKKVMEMKIKNGIPLPQAPADIQVDLLALSKTEPLVGLEYITEHQKKNKNHRYFCELCDVRSNCDVMLGHVISRRHRLRFMRTHFLDFYKEITGYPSFKGVMEPRQADVFLGRQSAFIVKTILKGVLKRIKTVPYSRDHDMIVNLESFMARGLVHPSQQSDMAKAEMLLEALDDHSPEFRNAATSSLLDEANTLERHIRVERSSRLNQQEGRVLNALKKLRESSMGLGMTREERIAYEKLQALLKNIHAEKNINLMNDLEENIGGIMEPAGLSGVEFRPPVSRPRVPPPASSRIPPLLGRGGPRRPPTRNRPVPGAPQPLPSLDHELDDGWDSREQAEWQSEKPTMSEIRKAVEPLIEKTRQEVEKKILEALNSDRSLSSLTEKFKNNPDLTATLKQWEEKHSSSGPRTSGLYNQGNEDEYRVVQGDMPPRPLGNILKRPFRHNSPVLAQAYLGASDNAPSILPLDNPSLLPEPLWGINRGHGDWRARGGRVGQFSDGASRLHRLAGDGASSHHPLEFSGPRPKIKRTLGSRPQFTGGTGRFEPF